MAWMAGLRAAAVAPSPGHSPVPQVRGDSAEGAAREEGPSGAGARPEPAKAGFSVVQAGGFNHLRGRRASAPRVTVGLEVVPGPEPHAGRGTPSLVLWTGALAARLPAGTFPRMANFVSLPGFRDFYPDDLSVRTHIMAAWRDVARRYGFREIDGPPLEPLELYVEKSGPEIVQQLYNFTDKGGREVAMRPEMTPTVARMAGARAGGLRKPIKWFSIPQLFRYERQQRGRLREHFQLNLDIIGEDDVSADAELLAAAIDVLRTLGLTADDFVARVSDRRLLRALLLHAGVPEDQLVLVYNIVDKLERDPREVIARRLTDEAGLDAVAAERVLELFRHSDFDAVRAAYGQAEHVAPEIARMADYLGHLRDMGLEGFVRFDLGVVRGLAYYTGIVFELFDRRGELRAICGGGRYDHLLKQVSGVDMPALGFGLGDVVLRELLEDRGKLPEMRPALDYYLVAVTPEMRPEMMSLAHRLRDAGHSVEYGLRHQGVGKQFKNADALGARRVAVLGPDEVAEGIAVVKDMESGQEARVPLAELGRP
jgi:histidyl-tRNA synthetase